MKKRRVSARLAYGRIAVLVFAGVTGCSDSGSQVLGGVPSIAYISQDSIEPGNVFDYQNGGRHGNIFTLTPPTASGVKKNLTSWEDGSINAMDLSFDAREIVFSGRAPKDDHYHV